jgi:hypothetical protein
MNEKLSEGIKLVCGNPTAEELAAAIAVVEAMLDEEHAAAAAGRQQPKSTWNRSSVNLRGGITPGFGQWKASFRDGLN